MTVPPETTRRAPDTDTGREPTGSTSATEQTDTLDLARRVLHTEASAILRLVEDLDDQFERAVQLLYECTGRVIVTGMGKSGIICRKIAATLSSTGTPAFFLHPAEAIHGDLGVIQASDVVLAVSHSGETGEILRLLETLRRLRARLIAVTGFPRSTLGQSADVVISCHVIEEACPMNLVPTASTTAALALGDALAMTLLVKKGFRQEDFVNLHPGGKLGKRLMRIEHLMHARSESPIVTTSTDMRDVVYEMSSKKLGMTCVIDQDGRLVGIITDGDLRRHMAATPNILEQTAGEVMTPDPLTVQRSLLAVEAMNIMEDRRVTSLVVVGERHDVEGVLHLHDLWRTQML